ncbi:MAG: ADP-ribosylglycohydrolase family protein [Microscillaceae bacterium]|nr:ADP-ribosylglycohydrolase family protein [Microscillaceae bacterium]
MPTNSKQPGLESRIKGAIMGLAVGDSLGLGTEYMSKALIRHHYPQGLHHHGQIVRDGHRARWLPGQWTEDTAMALCVLESLLVQKKVNSYNIATRLYDWACNDGCGIGLTDFQVIHHPAFLSHPAGVAREIWQQAPQISLGNEVLLRAAVLGLWQPENQAAVRQNAEKVCRLTHYHPVCVGSSVVVSLVMSQLIAGKTLSPLFFAYLVEASQSYDADIGHFLVNRPHSDWYVSVSGRLHHAPAAFPHLQPDLSILRLDEPRQAKQVYKALGAAFWALRYASSFEAGIFKIIHEGGDADGNAALAGALLGAKFGYEAIPQTWLKGLRQGEWLEQKVGQFCQLSHL